MQLTPVCNYSHLLGRISVLYGFTMLVIPNLCDLQLLLLLPITCKVLAVLSIGLVEVCPTLPLKITKLHELCALERKFRRHCAMC